MTATRITAADYPDLRPDQLAYLEGYAACMAGERGNPYPDGTRLAARWDDGFANGYRGELGWEVIAMRDAM